MTWRACSTSSRSSTRTRTISEPPNPPDSCSLGPSHAPHLTTCECFFVDAQLSFHPCVEPPGRALVDRRSSLHAAVIFRRPAVVKALLVYGADPEAKDKHGSSPLFLARSTARGPFAGDPIYKILDEHVCKSAGRQPQGEVGAFDGTTGTLGPWRPPGK